MTVDDFHLDNVDASQFEGCHDITIFQAVNQERRFVSKWKDGKKIVVKCPNKQTTSERIMQKS